MLSKTTILNPLSDEELTLAFFSPRLFQNTKRLEMIWREYIPGLTIVSGNRGSGKSTLINYYKKKYKHYVSEKQNEYKYFHLNIPNNGHHFFKDIFLFLESIELDEKNSNLNEIKSKLEELKDEILFNIAREYIVEDSVLSSDESQRVSKLWASIPLKLIAGLALESNRNKVYKNSAANASRIIKTNTSSIDDIQKKLIELLRIYSNHYKIIIILDELDKMIESDFQTFITENKLLFLESGIPFLVLIDKEKCIDIQYENSILSSIVREYIYLSELEWSEYIVVASRMSNESSLEGLREQFYMTKGNYRKLVNHNSIYEYGKIDIKGNLSNFYLFDFFINNKYIRTLPNIIRDVVKDYLFAVIDTYTHVGQLNVLEMEKLRARFARNELLDSVLSRVEQIIISQKDLSSIIKKEDQGSLLDEIKKFHQTKPLYLGNVKKIINQYKIKDLSTPEIKEIVKNIECWIDSIDFICITKQKKESGINNISYHCNIFISGSYIESTIITNIDGFAWNHELLRRQLELKEYLEKEKIPYVELELENEISSNSIFLEYSYQERIIGLLEQKYG